MDVQVHRERHGKVDDLGEVVVFEHRAERADGDHAAVASSTRNMSALPCGLKSMSAGAMRSFVLVLDTGLTLSQST